MIDSDVITDIGSILLIKAEEMADTLVEWRRALHQFPERGLEERMTASKIEGILSSLPGMEVFTGFGLSTCVIGRIRGDLSTGAVGFRAELDGVEVSEGTGLPFSSYDSRVSHAQGHDAHMASLLGTATLLSAHRDKLKRPVIFIFQPADEGKGGSLHLIEAGLFAQFNIEKMLCVHWVPHLPYGQIFTDGGGITSFSSKIHICLSGQGGHGATPYLAADPLFLSAQIQVALQAMITRELNPATSAVISFGRIEAAEAYNVIADETHLWGTVRTTDREAHRFLKSRIEEMVKGLARLSHITSSVEFTLNYDQVINDPELVEEIFNIGSLFAGSDSMERLYAPLLAGEDFSAYSERVSSCLMFLGTGMEYGLYHSRYDIPENLLPFASAWGACLALFL